MIQSQLYLNSGVPKSSIGKISSCTCDFVNNKNPPLLLSGLSAVPRRGISYPMTAYASHTLRTPPVCRTRCSSSLAFAKPCAASSAADS